MPSIIYLSARVIWIPTTAWSFTMERIFVSYKVRMSMTNMWTISFVPLEGIRGKQFKRNKKEYERLSQHIGLIPLVMVSPADASLIQGGVMNVGISWIRSCRRRIRSISMHWSSIIKRCFSVIPSWRISVWRLRCLMRSELQLVRYAEVIFEARPAYQRSFSRFQCLLSANL